MKQNVGERKKFSTNVKRSDWKDCYERRRENVVVKQYINGLNEETYTC